MNFTKLKHTTESNRLLRACTSRSIDISPRWSAAKQDRSQLLVCFNMVRDIATTLPYVPVLLKNQCSSLDMAPTCAGAHIVRPAGK